MKVLIDTRSLQGAYHFARLSKKEIDADDNKSIGRRLETFLGIIEDTGCIPVPGEGINGELRMKLLKDYDLPRNTSRKLPLTPMMF